MGELNSWGESSQNLQEWFLSKETEAAQILAGFLSLPEAAGVMRHELQSPVGVDSRCAEIQAPTGPR